MQKSENRAENYSEEKRNETEIQSSENEQDRIQQSYDYGAHEDLENRIEALIFLSKEPISFNELAKFYGMEKAEVEKVLKALKEKRKETGINIKIENEVVYLVSNSLYGKDVKRFFNPELKIKKLTKATMETLAIIAYKGPVTKSEIEQIKGVSVEKTISNLLEKNLIYISGKRKAIGTPNVFEVTEDFFSYLNVKNRDELPGYEQFREIELLENKIEVEEKKDEIK